MTTNALVAATDVMVPVTTSYYGLGAVNDFMETMEMVRQRINPKLSLLGILVTIHDPRTSIAKGVVGLLRQTYSHHVFQTQISKNVRLDEVASAQQSIFQYDPSSKGAADYRALLDEVMQRVLA